MDVKQIKYRGRRLKPFLRKLNDCFLRVEPHADLFAYLKGQRSDLPRKSIELIALAAEMPPRTLRYFLSDIP